MDEAPASSASSRRRRKRQQRKQRLKQRKALAAAENGMVSSPQDVGEQISAEDFVRINGSNHSGKSAPVAGKRDVDAKVFQSSVKAPLDVGNCDEKAVKERSGLGPSGALSPDRNAMVMGEVDNPRLSGGLHDKLHSQRRSTDKGCASIDTSPLAILHDDAVSKSGAKEKKIKKKRRRKNERIKLGSPEPVLGSFNTLSKSLESADSAVPSDCKQEPLNKQSRTESMVHGLEASKMRRPGHDSEVNHHRDAGAMSLVAPVQLGEALTSKLPKKKKCSGKRTTVSELTQFNANSQRFKSAKIKHDQDLDAGTTESSSHVVDQAPAHQSTTLTHTSSQRSESENANIRSASTSIDDHDNDVDIKSTDQSLQEPRIESLSSRHSSSSIGDEHTQPEALSLSGDFKTHAEADTVMGLVPANDESSEEEEYYSADEEASKFRDLTSDRKSAMALDDQSQSMADLSSQNASNRKHALEDDSNGDQINKRSRTDDSGKFAERSPMGKVHHYSASSIDSPRSESPERATGKAPSTPVMKPKQQGESAVESRPKAVKLKSSSNKFKSAKYVLNSEDEEDTELSGDLQSPHHSAVKNSTDVGKEDRSATQRNPRLSTQHTGSDSNTERSRGLSVTPIAKKLVKNYILGSRKMGPFDEQEQEIVKTFEIRYRAEHDLTERQYSEMLHGNAHNDKSKQAIWTELTQELPGRDRKAVQRFCRRKKHITGIITTPFTPEDDQQLTSLIARHGVSWVKIGQEMDRTADAVRDRYRNVLKDKATRKMRNWTASEIEELKRAVGTTAAKALENVPDVEDLATLVVWSSVSQEMKGERGRAQCANKWNDLILKGEVSLAVEIKKATERMDESRERFVV
ncbi:MAG: hypothetical protein GOMPHAMPRED_001370 [Gomphillus americanus]|uniref:Uncharacterized protein n=1 Tax=Gomphillus americanus TaxID=1940652 RepID=A0A8H3F403_9LECA|nr:MAG: hypothetical protein GOMPHAMPRED_001370 [Gomphillus americanus]